MLKEVKCLFCKHFDFYKSNCFNHICQAYPNGIPDEVFQDNSDDKDCKVKGFSFLPK